MKSILKLIAPVLKTWIFRLFKWLAIILYRRYIQFLLEQKVKRAIRLSKLENRRYIVTMFWGRPVCIAKKDIKEAIKRRKFKKGVTVQKVEQSAYFITK